MFLTRFCNFLFTFWKFKRGFRLVDIHFSAKSNSEALGSKVKCLISSTTTRPHPARPLLPLKSTVCWTCSCSVKLCGEQPNGWWWKTIRGRAFVSLSNVRNNSRKIDPILHSYFSSLAHENSSKEMNQNKRIKRIILRNIQSKYNYYCKTK